jgi:hypothetical protein
MHAAQDIIRRVGVNTLARAAVAAAARTLTFGWYKDYTACGCPVAGPVGTIEYVPILLYQGKVDVPGKLELAAQQVARLWPQGSVADFADALSLDRLATRLRRDAERYPRGSLFQVGIEPGYADNNDDRSAAEIVQDARALREVLDGLGRGYRLALGGISTPRSEWTRHAYRGRYGADLWREVLDLGGPDLFDAFVIHPYPTDPRRPELDDLEGQVRGARGLLAEYGLRCTELLVGETGTPFPGIPLAVRCAYAAAAVRFYLTARDQRVGHPDDDGRLVQRFCWFVLSPPEWSVPGFTDNPGLDFAASALVSPSGELTAVGQVFQETVAAVCRETEEAAAGSS